MLVCLLGSFYRLGEEPPKKQATTVLFTAAKHHFHQDELENGTRTRLCMAYIDNLSAIRFSFAEIRRFHEEPSFLFSVLKFVLHLQRSDT